MNLYQVTIIIPIYMTLEANNPIHAEVKALGLVEANTVIIPYTGHETQARVTDIVLIEEGDKDYYEE